MDLKTLYSYASDLDEHRGRLITEYRVGFEGKLAQKFEMYSAELIKLNQGSLLALGQMKELDVIMDAIRTDMNEVDF